MKFEIKHRYSGAVLFALECESLKLCVEAAVKAQVSLSFADLYGSDLSRDRKSTRLNSSHVSESRMPSSA